MRQVFSNLISNAVEAMSDGGKLAIHVRRAREQFLNGETGIRVTVADSGPGIDPEARQHMFEPFFTTKGERGTGLGLWVTQGIITKHGGSIRVRTFTGKRRHGTAFSVFIPEQRPESEPVGLD
jgi:signal transduction histidine kinase